MRRFIDVVFIHPKNRYYVVLHQGKFWQLARMNLTVSSWVFKLLYKGSLGDIFVARNQAVVDEKLSKILKTYELPAELHGLNANRFLDWWEMNDYKWLSTKDVITLDALPTVTTKPVEPPKTVITPAALAILQKKRLVNEEDSTATQAPPTPTTQQPTPAPSASLPDFDEVFAIFDELTKNDTPSLPNHANKIDLVNNDNQLNQFDVSENFDKLKDSFGQTDTNQIATQPSNTEIESKTVINDSLLGRFKLSPELADFAPDSAIASPIPNPPPKFDVGQDMDAQADDEAFILSPTQPTTEPQEPMSMPQPTNRPMSKLHEFNAQYAKKSTAVTPERPVSVAKPRPLSPLANLANGTIDPQSLLDTPVAHPNPTPESTLTTTNQIKPASQMAQPTPVKAPPAPESKPRTSMLDESFDIFDNLLKELTDELIP